MKVVYVKKKTLFIAFIIIILFITLSIFFYKSKAKATLSLPITNKVVVIDPGHGGVDPGTVSKNDVLESEINLKVSLKLKSLLEQSGAVVIMTRKDDKGLYTPMSTTLRQKKVEDLKNRRQIVNESECDIFVSVHMNSFTNSKYYGAQTFFNKGSGEGERLASEIQNEFRQRLDKDNLRAPTPRDDIYILKEIEMPAVLIEAGFLSNPLDEKLLVEEKHQEKVAWSIFSGIINYMTKIEE